MMWLGAPWTVPLNFITVGIVVGGVEVCPLTGDTIELV